MAEIKLTKNELRNQQIRLAQLKKYLPTLQLKKAMLQVEVQEAKHEIDQLKKELEQIKQEVDAVAPLLDSAEAIDLSQATQVIQVHKRFENIAGVEVPYFERVDFVPFHYSLFETPAWLDGLIRVFRQLTEAQVAIEVAEEKKEALEKELREVSIRVNLFEKRLIPRALKNIKKIKISLSDRQLAAVSQAKIAKAKLLSRQQQSLLEQGDA